MVAILVDDVDQFAARRRALGIDKIDERWRGTWHFVNPPKRWHAKLNTDLLRVLADRADARGLDAYGDATGVFASNDDWRVPDQVYARPEHATDEGVTSAELVVEVRSPGDETYTKFGFYAARGIAEILVVDEERVVQTYRLSDNRYGLDDAAHSDVLGLVFTALPGPRLRMTWEGGHAEV